MVHLVGGLFHKSIDAFCMLVRAIQWFLWNKLAVI